jgi:hypothetical protein
MDWKETDERLIRRGELILDPKHLENPRQELKTMNKHKRGRNYHISNTYIQLLAAIRYLYGMPYRQLEGFTRALHRLVPTTPTRADYSGIRKRILSLPVDPYRDLKETNEPVTIAVDSTGISVHKAGGWIERKHGKKRRYVKLHFAVNTETHEVVSMEVSTDDVHDVRALPGLVEGAGRNVEVSKVIGDGAYDSGRVYGFLEGLGVEPVIKPRRNARLGTGPPARRRAVSQIRELGYDAWARVTGYGRRWAVETAYSTFKRLFGEHSLARDFGNIVRELVGKVALYNMLVNV